MKLTRYSMELMTSSPLRPQMASLFHGVLMESIPSDYADYLHQSGLHPYTQHLEISKEGCRWIVTCLGEEAEEHIIRKGLENLSEFDLKRQDIHVRILTRKESFVTEEELTKAFYQEDSPRIITVRFLSPTSFKSNGKYLITPDIRCFYQSLMNKYDACSDGGSMHDEDTLNQLVQDTELIGYRLQSVFFQLEGVKIPSFIGEVRWKIRGPQMMVNYVNLLLKFGKYSGVGIKTALGMGAISLADRDGTLL